MKNSIDDLIETIKMLRDPEKGCPWDKVQTNETLAKHAIEEAYEVLEAVLLKDDDNFKEELGDLLMQVVIQSQIAKEDGKFDFNDVAKRINDKLIFRHPHVFGEEVANDAKDVVDIWDKAKKKEHEGEGRKGILSDITSTLPPLLKALKMGKRAAKVGFDWGSYEEVLDKLKEEIDELKDAKTKEQVSEEIGDLLFTCVNLARKLDVDPEEALVKTNLKFKNRIEFIEKSLENVGKDMENSSMEEKEELWDKSKKS